MAQKKKAKSRSRGLAVRSLLPARPVGAIESVRSRVIVSVRDYVKAIEGVLEWLEREIDRASSAAREQIDNLLSQASKRIESLEKRGRLARKRLTQPYRNQAARLVQRLEEGLSDAVERVGASAPTRKGARRGKKRRKRSTKKRA
jgi:hypothetical protein